MTSRSRIAGVALALCGAAGAVGAQPYPARPIRMIVPFAPGGPTDIIGRVMAAKLTDTLGQQVVIDNRAGAGGNIGMALAARAAPDGHTILLVSSSLMVNPSLYRNPGFDPVRDFVPVTCAAASPNVITAHPSQPFKGLKDLIALVRAQPGKFNFASPGAGTTPHLSGELLRLTQKIDLAHIPYAGAGPVIQAMLANQVTVGITAVPPASPHIKAGTLRGIAVTAAKRSGGLPEVPTTVESGVPGLESDTKQGVLFPAGTPKPVVDRVHAEIMKIMQMPDVKDRMAALGFEVIANTQSEFAQQMRDDIAKWGKAIRDANIRVE